MKIEGEIPAGSVVLPRNGGREYRLGPMWAVFKADEDETAQRLGVSECWLGAHTDGPGAHSHGANDEIFLVVEGTPQVRVGDAWVEAPAGSFFMIPAGTVHDFRNRSDHRAGLFNVWIPGGFERKMPEIVRWFEEQR